ncbi:lipase maturation factor family protein [Arthrobacter sp. zg-Y820]|uniref:lipase maturation factor family protein n=1 Tax=unclassified Arthrobacter TaxID=235627 RepID=UPI001E36076C|nr:MULTISPECIES: lipase maturation factor family protein [unclassified Arthrobacter]MCC9196366.1 lipase maturation factor family protein [Arthrobacter sp. zg-Y820]MDK1279227.1 lipase maturation factor family protein [Arthrobacter sp. zg.Y820]WIB08375.1 lipase maturation factor family protein [Arthrobacter sp. zg-Y820]
MELFNAEGYEFARQVLQRGIAAVYLLAFISAANQFPALLGEHGLLPAPRYLARIKGTAGRGIPTLFRRHYSDRFLLAVAWSGAAVAALLVAGLPQSGPPWQPMAAFLLIWFLYLSIVNVGQTFYAFGWESLLLEAGFLAAFLGSTEMAPPVAVLFLFRWLVFRLEFGAGLIKMRGDRVWRDLTALYYHHETQPMPNPASWYFHHLPKPLHRAEVLGNHFAQLVVPFFLFFPQPVAGIAAAVVIFTQCWLVLSGNFAWLNVLTILITFSAVADSTVQAVLPWAGFAAPDPAATPVWFAVVVLAVTALMLYWAWEPLRNLFSSNQLMNASFNRWHLSNAYGAFGSITRSRNEVVLEGTLDEPGPDARWLEYGFKGKPGNPSRRPRQFAPYHLRLDWLMWFLALGAAGGSWFPVLLQKLLEGDRRVLALLRTDPFAGTPPRWIRARVYRYRFSTPAERRADGVWWVREPAGFLTDPVGLIGPSSDAP